MNDSGTATSPETQAAGLRDALRRPALLYSIVLFVAALTALHVAVSHQGLLPEHLGTAALGFFFVYGLFTISIGYMHPGVGYVSFDRVAQVAGILVLGPAGAAFVNGAASLCYPWHRLFRGRPLLDVIIASLHNAGLMTLMILVCGLLYQKLGGPVPLTTFGLGDVLVLLVLMLSMQALNDLGMRVLLAIEEGRKGDGFDLFAFVVESGAGLGGILVAIVYNRMDLPVVGLLLLVMSLGMLTLTQLAKIRTRLEERVQERTRSLQEKTLALQRLATHDPLTGLHNRRFADDYLDERIAEFERYRRSFAVALVDLDHFKRINDNFSHDAGDQVLKAVSAILGERCRDTDLVSRYGGEEFLLCFPQADLAAAREACEKIRDAVESTEWSLLVPGARVTLSAGISLMRPGLNRRALLGEADRALYDAKAAGRNQIMLHDSVVHVRFQ